MLQKRKCNLFIACVSSAVRFLPSSLSSESPFTSHVTDFLSFISSFPVFVLLTLSVFCCHLSSQFFLPVAAALSSELFVDSSVEEELSSEASCDGELQAIMREFDQMFPLEFPSVNLNSLTQGHMPLSLAVFDSSDDSD